jgi:membrane protein DedA with SNARE-associated domain
MSLEAAIGTYGYLAVVVGAFLEGEIALVLGGLAAQRGYLELHWVMASAFLGTLCADQFYFHLGRFKGAGFLARRPRWQRRSEVVLRLMHRNQVALILGFRFMYGLRVVTPFLLGTSGVSPLLYLGLNILSAMGWAVIIGWLGYAFGRAAQEVLANLQDYDAWLFGAVVAIGLALWLLRRVRARRQDGEPSGGPED